MSSITTALRKFLENPTKNWGKIVPYIKSRYKIYERAVLEFLNIEIKSKPYSGHDELINAIGFRDGFFVVCGGNDGYGFDPTYYLEKFRGWTGIIVEPLPKAATLCKKKQTVFKNISICFSVKRLH